MLEILQLIQTLALLAILFVFVYFLITLKKEVAKLNSELDSLKRDVAPLLVEVKSGLDTMNKILNALGRSAESAANIVEKVRNTINSLEEICIDLKNSYVKTKGKMSILKLGFKAGVGSLISYYINKRRMEK